jgi:hypothetical protein
MFIIEDKQTRKVISPEFMTWEAAQEWFEIRSLDYDYYEIVMI